MEQNVFMTSMYFFIPLKRISKKYLRDYKLSFGKMEKPAFTESGKACCQFAQIPFSDCENRFHFTYNTNNLNVQNTRTRHIQLKAYVLKYRSVYNSKHEMPILMIGTSIDKLFPIEKDTSLNLDLTGRICTMDDLVFLKCAFTSKKKGLVDDVDGSIMFHAWLNKLVAKIENRKERASINMIHSICDVKGLSMEVSHIHGKYSLDTEFTNKYYNDAVTTSLNTVAVPSIEKSLCGNYKAFIYGLLFGNDNYDRGVDKDIDSYMDNAFSNNISEITVAAPESIVFVHTHHPFRKDEASEKLQRGFRDILKDVQNIYEMCEVIYAERRIDLLKRSLREISPSTIIGTLLGLTKYMERDLFNLVEMDKKVNYIFEAIGVNKQFDTLKEMAEMASRSTELKVNNRLNILMIILAVSSAALAIVQIIQNYILKN